MLDFRGQSQLSLSPENVRKLADRKIIGCDQLLVLEPSSRADVFMRIYNPDGSESSACGNGTRCVAALLGGSENTIETKAGVLRCRNLAPGKVKVDMGEPGLSWREIPLSREEDTLSLPIESHGLAHPTAVSMGNPHAVFFAKNAAALPLEKIGPEVENNPLFPERANVTIAEIISPTRIKARVWERGAGATLACGTAACATLVAAARKNLSSRKAFIELPGGGLEIEWAENGHILMTGPAETTFTGSFSKELLS